jgi:hypothetical protein
VRAVLIAVVVAPATFGGAAAAQADQPRPVAAPANAGLTAAEPLGPQQRSRRDVIPKLNPGAVEYYTEKYGVSPDEARRRLADQARFGDLDASLGRELGDTLASVEYDNPAGEWIIGVTPEANDSRVARATRDSGVAGVARIETRVATDTELRRIADDLVPEVARILDGDDERFAVTLNRGRVVVDVPEDTGAAELEALDDAGRTAAARAVRRSPTARATAGSGSLTTVRRSKPAALPGPAAISCSMPYCDTLMGGISIWLYANDAYPIGPGNGGFCTAGFWVGYPGGPRVSMLTAGHCIHAVGQPWGTCSYGGASCHNVGSQVTGYNGGPASAPDGDAGLIKQDVAGFGAHPGYVNWATLGIGTIRWYEQSNPATGQIVCKEGVTTGNTCGTVTASYANISPDADGRYYTGLFQSDACSQQGDSGGPWLRAESDTAVGITSHGNYAGSCGPHASYGEPISRPLQRWGATIYGG